MVKSLPVSELVRIVHKMYIPPKIAIQKAMSLKRVIGTSSEKIECSEHSNINEIIQALKADFAITPFSGGVNSAYGKEKNKAIQMKKLITNKMILRKKNTPKINFIIMLYITWLKKSIAL